MALKVGDTVIILTDKDKHGGDAQHYLKAGTEAIIYSVHPSRIAGRPTKYVVESNGKNFIHWDARTDCPEKTYRQYVNSFDVRFVSKFYNLNEFNLKASDLPDI